jgi:hypothetical protein
MAQGSIVESANFCAFSRFPGSNSTQHFCLLQMAKKVLLFPTIWALQFWDQSIPDRSPASLVRSFSLR